MITFRDILSARAQGPVALNAASLGRVYQQVQKSGVASWAILTAWRDGNDPSKNTAHFQALEVEVRATGLGFSKLLAHWRSAGGVEAIEPHLFVPGISLPLAMKLGRAFEQDAIMFARPRDGVAMLIGLRDGSELVVGTFDPGKIAQVFSEAKGRSFTFKGFEYPAQSFFEGLVERAKRRA